MMPEELNILLSADKETEHLEFKEAKKQLSILGADGKEKKSLYGYCVAIGNEGGGYIIYGVKDKINPTTGRRDIVGSNCIQNIEQAKRQIFSRLNRRIEIHDMQVDGKNIYIVKVPSHPIGEPFKFYDVPLMRSTEELVRMDNETLRGILNEGQDDFSAQINKNISLADLDDKAISALKEKLVEKTKQTEYVSMDTEELLNKLLLIKNGVLTNAALLLLGTEHALSIYLPQAEFALEWRENENKTDYDYRNFFRQPFLLAYDMMWREVDARNQRTPFRQGFIESDIFAYDKESIREALLNAFAHREYFNRTEPVVVNFSPDLFLIKSPGGLVPGVKVDNILYVEGKWRNRFLMEVLATIGLVERAGLGLDRIYKKTISDGKGSPTFEGTDSEYVTLSIPTRVKDINFVYFLEKVIKERQIPINHVRDFIELEKIRETGIANDKERLQFFLNHDLVEKIGKTRGIKYILSKEFYEFIDHRGEYTRKKWLSRNQQKALLLNYFEQFSQGKMSDFRKLFEDKITKKSINILLNELRNEGVVFFDGDPRSSKSLWRKGTEKGV